MLSRRNLVMMLTMFGVVLVLFLSTAVLREYFNDYDVNQWKHLEQVHDEQIVAVAQAFFRNGRLVDEHTGWYRLYRFLWTKNLTIRRCCLALLRWSGLEKHSLG